MSDVVYADLVDADPAPREITPTGRRYIAAQATYGFVVAAVLLLVFPSAFALALVGPNSGSIGSLLFGLALAAVAVVWAAKKRAALNKVLVDGTQRPARLVDVSHLVVRRGLVSGRRVSLVIEVDGRRATCVSWAGDLDEAEQGAWIRVLVHPDTPQLVVPVVSVT